MFHFPNYSSSPGDPGPGALAVPTLLPHQLPGVSTVVVGFRVAPTAACCSPSVCWAGGTWREQGKGPGRTQGSLLNPVCHVRCPQPSTEKIRERRRRKRLGAGLGVSTSPNRTHRWVRRGPSWEQVTSRLGIGDQECSLKRPPRQRPAIRGPCDLAWTSELHSEPPGGEPVSWIQPDAPVRPQEPSTSGQQPQRQGLQTASSPPWPPATTVSGGEARLPEAHAFVQGRKDSKAKGPGFPFRWRARHGEPDQWWAGVPSRCLGGP